MRKSTALGFALCGTLLVILLFIAGRMLYIKFYHQSFTEPSNILLALMPPLSFKG